VRSSGRTPRRTAPSKRSGSIVPTSTRASMPGSNGWSSAGTSTRSSASSVRGRREREAAPLVRLRPPGRVGEGEIGREEAIRRTSRDTRRLVRKQRTWARGLGLSAVEDRQAVLAAAERAFGARDQRSRL
jgi:hypothetical protein